MFLYKIRFLFLSVVFVFSCLVHGKTQNIDLSISNSKNKSNLLELALVNNSNSIIKVDDFKYSHHNDILIKNDEGRQVSFGFIVCGYENKKVEIKRSETKTWSYDLNTFFNNSLYRMPEGTYEISWVVNDVASEPYIYHHKN